MNPKGRERIASFFKTEFPLNKDGLAEFIGAFNEKKIPKGTLLLKNGNKDQVLRFLNTGTVREFYKTEKKEININFYTRPQFISDFYSFISDVPSKKYQETLSEVTVLELGRERFSTLHNKYSCGKTIIDQTFEKLLRHKELLEYNRITKEPEELYKEILIYKPDWIRDIPQYHIASYLGITAETLSRIRKRIS